MLTKPATFRFTVYAALLALTSTVAWVFMDVALQLGLRL
jgi:hypothetical protein